MIGPGRWLVVALAGIALAPQAAGTQGDPIAIDSLLVVERAGGGRRCAVAPDPVEARLARATWETPEEGDEIRRADGSTRRWRRIRAGAGGLFEDPALRGAYAVALVRSPREQVRILEARGHRHVYVNGTPRIGDLYDLGITRVPVLLRRGDNELLFKGGRGRLRARLVDPPAEAFLGRVDRTLPDALEGEGALLPAAVLVTNATTHPLSGLSLEALAGGGGGDGGGAGRRRTALPPLGPLAMRKAGFEIEVPPPPGKGRGGGEGGDEIDVELSLRDAGGRLLDRDTIRLRVRTPRETRRLTFRSRIDGSVQYYAVVPPPNSTDSLPPRGAAGAGKKPALVLTLHGAGVEAAGQARCYAPKDGMWIVAPTNRRPFGFDWEDWGRLDALEVLEIAGRTLGTDPRRTYLTGHSMGGHGTWSLGALFPDRFAAIAPSAGWRDFWSYGGGAAEPDPADPVEALVARAESASRPLLLERNYLHEGVYILHGDRDDNVPVEQARFLRARLGAFHPNFAYYERPGAGHWWGNPCVDWPPLFEFLRHNVRPRASEIRHVEFATVNPGISARCDWVLVEGQEHWMEASRVDARIHPGERRIEARTENITRLTFDLAGMLPPGDPVDVVLDGGGPGTVPWPAGGARGAFSFERDPGRAWRPAGRAAGPPRKGPRRAGPFKDAFRQRMILVFGSGGSPRERAWAAAKARYDAEQFWYRGNGSVDVVADADFDPAAEPDRSVILYGNAATNRAWGALLAGAPVRVDEGSLRVGGREVAGADLACLFVYPRPGSESASVGVVAGSGIVGMRLTNQLPYFVSGVGYPDWIVLGVDALEHGAAGIRGAGFFDGTWAVAGDEAWRAAGSRE